MSAFWGVKQTRIAGRIWRTQLRATLPEGDDARIDFEVV
jgi:hypothetical protein